MLGRLDSPPLEQLFLSGKCTWSISLVSWLPKRRKCLTTNQIGTTVSPIVYGYVSVSAIRSKLD